MRNVAAILVVLTFIGFTLPVLADVGPSWMNSGDDAEQKVSSITEKVFNGIVMFAAAIGAIALAWGLVEYHGIIGEKENGVRRIKRGIIGICIAGTIYAIVTFFSTV